MTKNDKLSTTDKNGIIKKTYERVLFMTTRIPLTLLSDETHEISGNYVERIGTYRCPCGSGKVVWSKERPNGGYGYQATFSDIFCPGDTCKGIYAFSDNGYAII